MNKALYFLLTLLPLTCCAQDVVITRLEMSGDKLNIYYSLADSTNRNYTVNVFSSKDNFVTPLEKVSGDMGLEVNPGANKKITWAMKEELGANFAGKVTVELRGRIYIPFVRLNGNYSTIKRAKPYEVTWTGGTERNILNFDLYRGGEKVTTFSNIANVGHHSFTLPANVKPGTGYSFKITDTRNKDQEVNTTPFTVKRKVPLLLKVLPFVAIGAIALTLPKSSSAASIPLAPDHP